MKSVFPLLWLLVFPVLFAQEAMPPLEKWIGRDGEIFQSLDGESFLSRRNGMERCYFQWTSKKKDEARYPGYSNSPMLTFCGYEVPEVILSFEEKKLKRVVIFVYNRGDMGALSAKYYARILEKLDAFFSQGTGDKGRESKTDLGKSVLYQKAWLIASGNISVLLRYSSSGKGKNLQAEYIQITYEKTQTGKSLTSLDVTENMSKGKGTLLPPLVENVKKEPDNSVYIDNIPMVDQGDKQYCSVAVAERLMRYYGNQVINQHTIAQMAETSEKGTYTANMIKAMKRIAGKCGYRFRVRYELTFESVKDIEKYVKQYNSLAKKKKKNKVEMIVRDNTVYADETFAQMDPEIVRALRLANRIEMAKFFKNIKTSVDKGVPLIWGITMGLVDEPGVMQAEGGHIRLIIGYNEEKKYIYYSDSWGKGHEKKRMSYDDAWYITHALMTLEP